jgi:hypothetical protein
MTVELAAAGALELRHCSTSYLLMIPPQGALTLLFLRHAQNRRESFSSIVDSLVHVLDSANQLMIPDLALLCLVLFYLASPPATNAYLSNAPLAPVALTRTTKDKAQRNAAPFARPFRKP